MKTFIVAGKSFVLPFKAVYNWVEDAKGRNVCEAYDGSMAIALAEMLNEKADPEYQRLQLKV